MSPLLVLGLAGSTFADASMTGKFYSEGTGLNGISNSSESKEVQAEAQPSQPPALRRILFDIGAEVYQYEYEEPGVMEMDGMFYGIRFGVTDHTWVPSSPQSHSADGGMMFRADGRLAFGQQLHYDGALMDGTPYTSDNNDDWVFEGRLALGNDWLHRNALHTVYAGIGYRYLNDDSSSDPSGYERESNYLYVPIGYQFDSSHAMGWSFGFGAEFDVFIVGIQRSHLSDVSLEYSDIDNRQNTGYGYRASVKLQHKSKTGIFVVEPFIRYWDIDDSEYEYVAPETYFEPANETTEIGISLLWMY